MEEQRDNKVQIKNDDKDEIYSNVVRAGKRTYFFDVRATRGNDLYLTITESKRRYNDDGSFHYQKHKIFLYKEDFEKFSSAMSDTIKKVIELQNEESSHVADRVADNFTDVNFDDLGTSNESSSASE
ncbi:MAG: DUF3276 family protein [Flavobacteriales bacterium]|nr:DUF3276 family protein [Flavobacteriales bacterium]